MSIESISQNNYVLATQQAVSHDASLSGNGTVESPLSVVPGYNETVLYETTATTTTSTAINLSEPLTNFERVKINFVASETTSRGWWFEYNTNNTQYNANPMRTDDGGIVQAWGSYAPSNNYSTLTFNYGRYMVLQKTSTNTTYGNITFYITKVIGINRKA